MIIGTSSYTFSKYIKEGLLKDEDVIKKAVELGFEAIEFTDLKPVDDINIIDYAKHLKSVAEENGIFIPCYAVGGNLAQSDSDALEKEVERLKLCVDVADALGAKYMRHDVMFGYDGFSSFDAALPTIVKYAREITEYACSKSIVTLLENHGKICQDPDRIERIIHGVNHTNYGLLLDTGNFLCADLDPVKCASRLAPFVKYVHLKDAIVVPFGEKTDYELYETRACNHLDFVVVGNGHAKVAQTVAILKSAGFDGNMDVEYEGRMDCIEAVKESIINIKKML